MTAEHNTAHIDKKAVIFGAAALVIGLVLVGMGMSTGMKGLGESYLYAWVVLLSMTQGCFSLGMLFHITRGRWGVPLLRIFEAAGGPIAIGFTLVAFLPIAFVFRDNLYHAWLAPAAGDMVVLRKSTYLNLNFWLVRTIGVQLIFILMAALLRNWTLLEEKTGDKKYSDLRNNCASPFFVAYFILMTFLMTDVVMSLDPHWFSTIFASIFVIANALLAFGFAVVLVLSNRKKDPFKAIAEDSLFLRDFGNFSLMLVMVWTYFTFSQLLIIWSGNLPSLTSYYRARMTGNYGTLGFFQLAFNFAMPFVALLTVAIKRYPVLIMMVAGFIVVFRLTDLHYVVMPFVRTSLELRPADFGAVLALFGLWGLQFGYVFRSANPIVASHPYQTHIEEAPAHA